MRGHRLGMGSDHFRVRRTHGLPRARHVQVKKEPQNEGRGFELLLSHGKGEVEGALIYLTSGALYIGVLCQLMRVSQRPPL